jgi:hypothetical protein
VRIENLRRHRVGDRMRIEARFIYEDSNLPPVDVYYEAGPPLADALESIPEAFVLSGLPIALWEGERRLKVEGALDAKLAAGLGRASALLASWYDRCGSIVIEPTDGLRNTKPRPQPRAVALMSGGVDALGMLVDNRRRFALDDPSSIRTVVYAFGYSFLDRPKGEVDPFMRARYEAQATRLEALGEQVGFDVVRLDSNVRLLDPHRDPFYYTAHGGAYLAPLVASPGCVSDALIASVGEGGPTQTPHGSHPRLDVEYTTGAVQVRHEQVGVPRTDKVRMIAAWEPAFGVLQVCPGWLAPSPDVVNCGQCEKCIRTMVGLLVHDALAKFTTFPHDDVTPEMIDAIQIKPRYDYLTVPEVIAGLESIGREDLVRAIHARVERQPRRKSAGPTRRWHRVVENGLRRFRRLGA